MATAIPVYRSSEDKTEDVVSLYSQTHNSPHRYLAYKKIPRLIRQFVKGKKTLDYGSGTGASSAFLHMLGLDVTGIDINSDMLIQAKANLPNIEFYKTDALIPTADFDLVFSSFVLFELGSKEKIVKFLSDSSSFLKNNGIFIGITGSEQLYSISRHWMTFDANFKENCDLRSGDLARLLLKHPRIEFYDYYWEEKDYLDCFLESGLKILKILYPLGSSKDPHLWKDELSYSPFAIFVAQKEEGHSLII